MLGTDNTPKGEFIYGIPHEKLPSYSVKPPIGYAPTEVHDGVNHELLDEIMEFIKIHPTQWRQSSWYMWVDPETGVEKFRVTEEEVTEKNSCGSSMCFAGHVALHEGFPSPPVGNHREWERGVIDRDANGGHYFESVDDFALKRLGLSHEQGDVLFDGGNTLKMLERIVELLHRYPNDVDCEIIRRFDLSDEELEEYIADEGLEGLTLSTAA